jgi:deoxyribodipyrimidine photo-lyase
MSLVPSKSESTYQVVWFKRDLRILDHAPLFEAAQRGPVLCLYLYEDEILQSPEFATSHLIFINQSLVELEQGLRERGSCLVTRRGEAVACFERLWRETPFKKLWSHAETGNLITYQRDLRVVRWCQERGVDWEERRQDGVIRRLRSRNGWAMRWEERMKQPLLPAPARISTHLSLKSEGIMNAAALGLGPSTQAGAQAGGATLARQTLDSFLTTRGVNYRVDMSSPVGGWEGCSRLSAYLAWGCLSLRTVAQETATRLGHLRELRAMGGEVDRRWLGSLRSFEARLRWHCHFMQKLEDEPRIEHENFVRAYDGLREEFSRSAEGQRRLYAWVNGQTGYPMVDACLRCVRETGWLNFRMRAMVASFAAYYLGLHWRATGLWLGRQFLDFEPGIHWSQFQMQSGTTGINVLRIYSPAKQARDHDPEGLFIRCWVPELERVPLAHLARPDLMTSQEQGEIKMKLGLDYPLPIVDPVTAPKESKARITELRRQGSTRAEAQQVLVRHGSRKKTSPRKKAAKKEDKKKGKALQEVEGIFLPGLEPSG